MTSEGQILRPKAGVRALFATVYLAGVAGLTIHLPLGIPNHHRIWIVPIFAAFGAFALVDISTRRIALGADGIRIVSISDFQSRTIARTEIDNVTWAKGGGAFLKLRDGRSVSLPNVGRDPQGITNTIRTWLKKTENQL